MNEMGLRLLLFTECFFHRVCLLMFHVIVLSFESRCDGARRAGVYLDYIPFFIISRFIIFFNVVVG